MTTYRSTAGIYGRYVRVGDNSGVGVIETSVDGAAWVATALMLTLPIMYAVCQNGAGGFVAVGANGTVCYSPDGTTWYTADSGTTEDLYAVAAYNPVVMACGNHGTVIFSDNTGLVWETLGGTGGFSDVALRSISIADGMYYIVGDEEAFLSGPLYTTSLFTTVGEYLTTSDSSVPQANGSQRSITDAIETFGSDDSHSQATVREGLECDEDDVAIGRYAESTTDTIKAIASLFAGFFKIVDETLTTADVPSPLGLYTRSVTDVVALADAPTPYGRYLGQMGEMMTVQGAVNVLRTVYQTLTDTVGPAESVSGLRHLVMFAMDGIGIEDGVTYGFIDEGPPEEPGGERPGFNEPFETWAYNTEGKQVSRYTNAGYTSMVATQAGIYATDGDNIYCLEGSDDNGTKIGSYVEWGTTDFGTAFKKGEMRAYIGTSTSGQLLLRVITDQKEENWYEVITDNDSLHGARIKIGKGLKAHYWKFRLENIDGAGLDLESAEFLPVVLARRV